MVKRNPGMVIYKELNWETLMKTLKDSVKDITVITIILAFSGVFDYGVVFDDLTTTIASALVSITTNKTLLLFLVILFLLLCGMFMENTVIALILTPILLPVVTNPAIGMDPVHFGVVMIFNLAVGLCTPPVGSALFVGCAIGKTPIERTAKNMMPLYLTMVIVLMLVTYIPDVSLLLPRLLMGYGA